uniref:Uncharacterized protein n=1 Tax=Arundo donax TaxID=35708 RepID=A0A0A9BD37_ARUDO
MRATPTASQGFSGASCRPLRN